MGEAHLSGNGVGDVLGDFTRVERGVHQGAARRAAASAELNQRTQTHATFALQEIKEAAFEWLVYIMLLGQGVPRATLSTREQCLSFPSGVHL